MMNRYTSLLILFFTTLSLSSYAENLVEEKIRRLSTRKKSVFLSKGIFHNGGPKIKSKLNLVRQNYSSSLGYERVVFDFATSQLPRIYGYISQERNKLYIDFFETEMSKSLGSFGNSKYVEAINFFPIQEGILSAEVVFKSRVSVDLFSLESPGRLVIDLKK